jgi:pimeloyl-ACP methyl ester carboxylesterase/GNAT superfamily N-acetyltransferase
VTADRASGPSADVAIRRAGPADAAAVAEVFLASFHATYDFPLAHTDAQVRDWVRDVLVAHDETWVATDGDAVVALLTVAPGWVEQLYVAPDRLGEGIGRQLLDLAKSRSQSALRLYTFQVNARARRFYERNGFVAEWFGDGSANEEGQPDVRYVWRARPDRLVRSRDGVDIAIFATPDLTGATGSPIVLVHGATADHTTWRTSGPLLAARHELAAIDRRGRGDSGDGAPDAPYAIEREFDDLVAVVEAVSAAGTDPRPVDVVGHSYGGRIALGAALRTDRIRRLVVYEGAPPVRGAGYQTEDAATLRRVEALMAAGERDEALATFMREIVGMPEPDLAAFRADPIWPRRAAAVDTTIRELRAETSPAASLDALGAVDQPVLQVIGGSSSAPFAAATQALDARLRNGRVVTIAGARHAAHHTHAAELVAAIEAFLAEPDLG